ncbi:hypothetical protein KAR91_30310 [Candidatus Pacearchaeota archaeon]|nr:hypothetical protein [Candidatus Pacearchaeota archaeon]
MILNPQYQEINIPGIRKLKGGDFISENIISKLKTEKTYDKFKEYFISEEEDKKLSEAGIKGSEAGTQLRNEKTKNKVKNEFTN